MLREISRPKPRFGVKILGVLPEQELPEVELALVEHLRRAGDLAANNLAALIHRYAGTASEAPVASYLDERLGQSACGVEYPLLAYLLKVDPPAARPRLEKAMAARGCNRFLLREVAQLQNDPVLEEIADNALDDADPQIAGNAAEYLGQYGPATAESLLWSHLAAWRQRSTGHENDAAAMQVGMSLLQAQATGQNWLADETSLRKLAGLASVPWQRQQVEYFLNQWQTRPWTILFIGMDKPQFRIAQYEAVSLQAAKNKLGQFPSGSEFRWLGDDKMKGAAEAFRELSQFAEGHGIHIARSEQ
jgi:hypothetical protein